jgi:hypothetical protein
MPKDSAAARASDSDHLEKPLWKRIPLDSPKSPDSPFSARCVASVPPWVVHIYTRQVEASAIIGRPPSAGAGTARGGRYPGAWGGGVT